MTRTVGRGPCSMTLRKAGILPHHYTLSQHKKDSNINIYRCENLKTRIVNGFLKFFNPVQNYLKLIKQFSCHIKQMKVI
jgi:hypothetical protein